METLSGPKIVTRSKRGLSFVQKNAPLYGNTLMQSFFFSRNGNGRDGGDKLDLVRTCDTEADARHIHRSAVCISSQSNLQRQEKLQGSFAIRCADLPSLEKTAVVPCTTVSHPGVIILPPFHCYFLRLSLISASVLDVVSLSHVRSEKNRPAPRCRHLAILATSQRSGDRSL